MKVDLIADYSAVKYEFIGVCVYIVYNMPSILYE